MDGLSYRRLDPSLPSDVATFTEIFRGAPSFVFPTGGRAPTDAEVVAMMRTVPSDRSSEDVFIYAISVQGKLCGCRVAVRSYPSPRSAYLALVLLVEAAQGRSLGPRVLRHVEAEAKSWGCSAIEAAVDSQNDRALKFWAREGFVERFRKEAKGFIGQAVAIEKTVL